MRENQRRCDHGVRGKKKQRFENAMLMASNMEERATNQGIQVALDTGKGKGKCSFLENLEGVQSG